MLVFHRPVKKKKPFNREEFLRRLEVMDRVLVQKGFPPLSPWWRQEIRRFILSGRRRWVDRVGRRGGKSSSLCRLAVAWALWGGWDVPIGDRGVVSFISISNKEAGQRVRTISEILTALDVPHSKRGNDEIELHNKNVIFWVITCSITGTVGHTSIAIFADEVSRWETRETAANPADEVMGSLRPTLAGVGASFEVCSSSPWSDEDFHAKLFDEGNNEHQIVSYAPTWVARPNLTEEETRQIEPDYKKWLREFKGIPGGTVINGWFGGAEDAGFVQQGFDKLLPGIKPVFAIDPAFGDRDLFGWAVLTSEPDTTRLVNGKPTRITRVRDCGSWDSTKMRPSESAEKLRKEVIEKWIKVDKGESVHVFSDQYEGKSFSEICQLHGILLEVVPWTAEGRDGAWTKGPARPEGKLSRFKSVRTALWDGSLKYHSEDLRRQFGKVIGILSPSGRERIQFPRDNAKQKGAARDGHLDMLSAVILAASIVIERAPSEADDYMPLSPEQREQIALAKHKQDALDKVQRDFRRRWDRNKKAVMREIMFR